MKPLVFASIIFTLCIVLVFVNSVYITGVIDSATRVIENESAEDAVERCREIWDRHRFVISLSVSLIEMDEVEHLLGRAEKELAAGDRLALSGTLGELREAIDDISKAENFSIEGIL